MFTTAPSSETNLAMISSPLVNFKLIDNDSDGVADALDTCPDTKKGSQVDDSGCCVDTKYVTFKD